MDPYTKFDSDLRSCRKCEDILRNFEVNPCESYEVVEPRPIVSGIEPKPILLLGQAPGLTEYKTRRPFQGSAGIEIRDIFRNAGVTDFDRCVYSSAVVKCFPGRKLRQKGDGKSVSEDCLPSTEMVKNCRIFLVLAISLANPKVIVTLGGFALKAYLQLSDQSRALQGLRLENYVGKCEHWQKRTVVLFPHTSGGSRWLNDADNRGLFETAKQLLRDVLIKEKIV
jgi:uracil-DNA glycosylase family 4